MRRRRSLLRWVSQVFGRHSADCRCWTIVVSVGSIGILRRPARPLMFPLVHTRVQQSGEFFPIDHATVLLRNVIEGFEELSLVNIQLRPEHSNSFLRLFP